VLVEGGDPSTYTDYTIWTLGTESVGEYNAIGSGSENYRITGPDPGGRKTVVWEVRTDAVSGADGGWTQTAFAMDITKMYRFSAWTHRTVLGASGRLFFGFNGLGSVNGTYELDTGNNNTNEYFWATSVTPTTAELPDEWILVVGHIWPSTTATGTARHSDSGRWYLDGSQKTTGGSYNRDFKWRSETTTVRQRVWVYYSTDATVRQRFCFPRIDVVDGTEPSISDLLTVQYDDFNHNSIRNNKTVCSPNFSEVGPAAANLIAYWPMDNNIIDFGGSDLQEAATGSPTFGEGLTGRYCLVLGSGDYYTFDNDDAKALFGFGDTDDFSVSAWAKSSNTPATMRILCVGGGGVRGWNFTSQADGVCRFRVRDATTNEFVDSVEKSFFDGKWHHYVATRDATTDEMIMYVDGTFSAQTTDDTDGNFFGAETPSIGYDVNVGGQDFIGSIQDVRIYNKVLTPTEVNILTGIMYDDDNPSAFPLSSKIGEDTWYATNEFEEQL